MEKQNQSQKSELGPNWAYRGVYEVTDSAAGHRVGGMCPENTVVTRGGNDLYFVYKTGGPEDGNQADHRTVFVRRLHLDEGDADPAVRAFLQAEDGSGYDGEGYHDEPAILRTASGGLLPLHTWSGQVDACRGTSSIPPRYRLIGDLDDPATWIPYGTDGAGLPSRVPNDHPHGAIFGDIMGVHDRPGGLTHAVGEGAFLQTGAFAGSCGLGRYYYRTTPEDGMDGPYLLVRAELRPAHDPRAALVPAGMSSRRGKWFSGASTPARDRFISRGTSATRS